MTSNRWRTGCVCITILSAMISLLFGGILEVIIPGSLIVAVMILLWRRENFDLYFLAAGQLLVYGAAYGSYIAAIVCEATLLAAVAGNKRITLLIPVFISLTILGITARIMHHTGWWIAGLIILCTILIISGYAREEALIRAMRGNLDE